MARYQPPFPSTELGRLPPRFTTTPVAQAYSRWQLAQPLVKRPVPLGNDLLAFVVGLPDGPLLQRHELDIYKTNGEPVAVGLPIDGVRAGRLIIADAGAGRLVLVGQQTWEPSATTTVWQVEVPTVESTL